MEYAIINLKTGETVRECNDKKILRAELDRGITKEMIRDLNPEIARYLYRTMKKEGKINNFGMIQVDGLYVSQEFFRLGYESGILAQHVCRLKDEKVLGYRGFIKKTSTTDCETWSEVMQQIGIDITNKRKVSAMKKLLIDNDVIREARKMTGKRCFVMNPNVIRHCAFTSDFCIATFKDVTLTKVDKYNTYLMFMNGLLDYEDIN